MDNNISFSKIVATPTLNAWSQAYNAGKLFAVISLEKTQELPKEIESLNILGKNLLERLEQEFFIIEDKNLESIKKAISVTFDQEVEGINISFSAGTFVGNILYLFGLGNAKVFIKREGNLGLALDSQNSTAKNIASSSGFLKEKDLIVLTTDAFSQIITQDEVNASLNNAEPSEIAESLAPKIHKAENGKISAIVIRYKNPLVNQSVTQDELGEVLPAEEVIDEGTEVVPQETIQERKTEKPVFSLAKYLSLIKSKFSSAGEAGKKPNFKFPLTKKLFLTIAIVIIGIIIFSVYLTIKQQNNAKVQALFAEIYPQAQKKYDEGQSLMDLNKSLARDSFQASQKILQDNKDKFPAKSKELTETQDLLKKVEDGLSQVSPIDQSGLDRSKLSITVQNGSGIEGSAGKAANILKNLGYNVLSTGNADNYNYQGITIKITKENSKFLDLLKKDLAKDYAIKSSSSDLSSDSSTDALIIIGK